MALVAQDAYNGMTVSPGGFEFGLQGWHWGDPRPTSITFFLDGSAMVSDQWGRAIKGAVVDGVEVWFATTPPLVDIDNIGTDPTVPQRLVPRKKLASHAQVIKALQAERIDWTKLTSAGWPQLEYEELKKLAKLPLTPIEELKKIAEPGPRRAALRIKREVGEAMRSEVETALDEE